MSIKPELLSIIQNLCPAILLSSHSHSFSMVFAFCSPVFCFHFMFLCLLFSICHLLILTPILSWQTPPASRLHPPILTHTHDRITFTQLTPTLPLQTTGQSVPSAPPQDITCTSSSSTSIVVSWAPPPLEFQNGIITGYTIQYSNTEGIKVSKRIERITPESSSYLLENLQKWTEYGITVRAQTEAGEGPESLQLLIRTEEDGTFLKKSQSVFGGSLSLTKVAPLTYHE